MSGTASSSRWSATLPDIVAGVSIAGLLLPEAVAYSSIGSLAPQAGIIALFAGLLMYGLLGKSRFAIVAATSSSAAVLAASTAALANGDMALRLALAAGLIMLTGVLFVVASLARFGNLSDFIAKPVLRGFAFGLAAVIIIKQLSKIVAIHPHETAPLPIAWELLRQCAQWNVWGLATGVAALALLVLMARLRRLPGALLVIALGVAASHVLGLQQHGVALVGDIHFQIGVPTLPALPWVDWMRLGELAFAMVLILYAESYSSIRSFALKHGDGFEPNRELLALGAANIVSGLFYGMPVGAGYSATSANEAAGAQSRVAGWVALAVVFLIVLTLCPVIALTPEPVLAAIVIHAVGHTLNPAVFAPYFQWRRDRVVVLFAVAAVLLLGVLDGLLAAIAMSLAVMLRQMSQSHISVLGQLREGHDYVALKHYPEAKTHPGLLIVRPETPLFFANADRVLGQLRMLAREQSGVHTVILSLEESSDLDSTSLEAIRDLAHDLAVQKKNLLLARLKDHARHALERACIPGLPATAMEFFSVDDAVCAAEAKAATPA
jgi:MFS superfamily sulfate permease-like transporter